MCSISALAGPSHALTPMVGWPAPCPTAQRERKNEVAQQTDHGGRTRPPLSGLARLDKGAKTLQPQVPLRRDQVEIFARRRQLLRAYLPLPIPSHPFAADQASLFEHMQMLGDTLTGNVSALFQRDGGERTVCTETRQHRQSDGITQRGEHWRRCGQIFDAQMLLRHAHLSGSHLERQIHLDELRLMRPATIIGFDRLGTALDRDLIEARLRDRQ